jgi:hypothetical protein
MSAYFVYSRIGEMGEVTEVDGGGWARIISVNNAATDRPLK